MGPDAFDYELPADRVAQRPCAQRTDARMLVVGPPHEDASVAELPRRLPEAALLVVNDSRVVPARVHATRDDGRSFELLVCDPSTRSSTCIAWVRGARRLRPGDHLQVGALVLRHEGPDDIDPRARRFIVIEGDVLATLHAQGRPPLPPYIDRAVDDDDRTRYQTVYARHEGSVAAPTAGLHFDEAMIAALDPVRIALHVGPGTFLPIDADDVRDHRVGAERIVVDESAAARIETARRAGRPIVAVGTTVVRALESIARHTGGAIDPIEGTTDLVVGPGFGFRVVTHLLTNFHLPRSSLLVLVCAFAGRERVLEAYRGAVARGYRFYSYGDCMLVDRREEAT